MSRERLRSALPLLGFSPSNFAYCSALSFQVSRHRSVVGFGTIVSNHTVATTLCCQQWFCSAILPFVLDRSACFLRPAYWFVSGFVVPYALCPNHYWVLDNASHYCYSSSYSSGPVRPISGPVRPISGPVRPISGD